MKYKKKHIPVFDMVPLELHPHGIAPTGENICLAPAGSSNPEGP